MLNIRKKTSIIIFLIMVSLAAIYKVGYWHKLLPNNINNTLIIDNTSNIVSKSKVNILENKNKNKQEQTTTSIPGTHCRNISINLTKIIKLSYISVEGITEPEAIVIVNDKITVKADSKGCFKAEEIVPYIKNGKNELQLEASDKDGNICTVQICLNCK